MWQRCWTFLQWRLRSNRGTFDILSFNYSYRSWGFEMFDVERVELLKPTACKSLGDTTRHIPWDKSCAVQSSWNVMAHGDAREGKLRGNWRIEWVASTLHTTSEQGVSSITTANVYTSAASSLLNWRSRLFEWAHPFLRKTKSGFCACANTFQTPSTCL